MSKALYTVYIFARLATKRFFRDRLSIFFGILFPVVFLLIFGSLNSNSSSNVSLSVALINHSTTKLAQQTVSLIQHSKVFKIDNSITTIAMANTKLN